MYRYRPPKSQGWGHRLKRMPPTRRKEVFEEFLRRTAAEYEWEGGYLDLVWSRDAGLDHSPEVTRHIELLLGVKKELGQLLFLTPEQFNRCLHELAVNPHGLPVERCFIILKQNIKVSQWQVDGQAVPTMSSFGLGYGTRPHLSTSLEFRTVEQFRFVQSVLTELQICRLSDRRLRFSRSATW